MIYELWLSTPVTNVIIFTQNKSNDGLMSKLGKTDDS